MQGTKTLECLLLIPPTEEFSSVRQLLVDILRESGIESIRHEHVKTTILTGGVQGKIERTDLIIADLTGNNPNIMYEMGLAHALKKPVLPIVQQRVGHIPSDITGYLFFVYDPSAPEEFCSLIRPWLSRFVSEWKRKHGDG